MVHRKIESVILEMLDIFRIVAINGPRQSGKTTLQKKIAKLRNMKYYTFEGDNGEKQVEHDIPEEMKEISNSMRETLLDTVSVFDDELAEKFLG